MEALLTSILTFFLFPSWGFFLGILLLSVIYTVATEKNTHEFSIFATFAAIFLFWKNLPVVVSHWHILLILVLIYGVIGGLWSVFRWFRYCREYIGQNPAHVDSLWEYVGGNKVKITMNQYYKNKLSPKHHKSRLIGWVVYWPWSLVWNIIGDFVTGIYDVLSNTYQKVAESVINKAFKA